MMRLTRFLKDSNGRVGNASGDSASRQNEALSRVISVLMQGIAIHGLRYDEADFLAFQNAVWKIRAEFDQGVDEDSALLLAGAVIRLLEEHNEAAQASLRARHHETAGFVGLTVESLLEVSHAKPQVVAAIRGMVQEIERASNPDALSAVRPRLELALAETRAKEQLPVTQARPGPAPAGETDSVTGLPDAGCAIEALGEIWQQRSDRYVALFALEYLETINQKFGFRTGDELLSQLSQHVGQHMAASDQLFRWRGPSVAALVKRTLAETFVATEMSRVVPARLESATIVGDREAMVRVSTSWTLIRLQDMGTPDDAIAKMNEFAGNRTPVAVRQTG